MRPEDLPVPSAAARRPRGAARRLVAGLAGALAFAAGPALTGPVGAAALAASADPVARARTRETYVDDRRHAAALEARAQALRTYRLVRHREAQFLARPAERAAAAQAEGAALALLRRRVSEAVVWRDELVRAAGERRALEEGAEAGEGAHAPSAARLSRRALRGLFRPPVRGVVLASPGLREDPASGVELRADGVLLLARMNEPVTAVADGEVRSIQPLPQGGFAVLCAHADGWVSLLSGLREVTLPEGSVVAAGAALGLVGRNLDGAPVLAYELWQDGTPVDPTATLKRRGSDRPHGSSGSGLARKRGDKRATAL